MAIVQGYGASSTMSVGYNIDEAGMLIDKVIQDYKVMGLKIKEAWESVVNTLQLHWVGPDEQAYEQELATRICNAYTTANEVVKSCCLGIEEGINQWINYQNNNTIDGRSLGNLQHHFQTPPAPDEIIVKARNVTFDTSTAMGLLRADSYNVMVSKIEEFTKTIKQQFKALSDEINAGEAFYGNQSKSVTEFIVRCEQKISSMPEDAIKVLKEYLAQLTKKGYTAQSESTINMMANNGAAAPGNGYENSSDNVSSRWQ